MSAKVDSASAAEPQGIKMSGVTSSAAPSGQKLSMFASKSGFVIPKNKLSGSLVPIYRGARRQGVAGATNEESSTQIHRKTKWGPDLTQDASVKRGRALALQIRVEQITKQLKSGKLEVENVQDSPSVAEIPDPSSSDRQIDSKKSEMLELEKREAIGEILKLDPSYKPPPGFKPLLKEATVPLPVKDYPGYNFFALIYGPEGDNQKRLEKETGARIQVHGTITDTGEKVELKGGYDVHCTYEEMHVKISADSFEKVDTAVSIIELLITSVTGNLAAASIPSLSVSGDNANVLTQGQDAIPSHGASMTTENQPVVQPAAGAAQVPGDHFQYAGRWFSTASSNTPVFASSGNIGPSNLSGSARPFHSSSQTLNPSDMALTFGAQPMPVAGFNSVIPNQPALSFQGQPPRQILQHSHMPQSSPLGHTGPPRNPSIISGQMPSAQRNSPLPFSVSVTQSRPIGQVQTLVPPMPQPMTGISPVPLPERPLIPLGVPSVQERAPGSATVTLGLSNMGKMAPPMISPSRPVSLRPQTDVSFKPPPSNIPMVPHSVAYPLHQGGIPPGPPSSLGPMQIPAPPPANHLSGSVSFPSSGLSTSLHPSQQSGMPHSATGVAAYQTSVRPPSLAPSNSGNFTFHPQQLNADFQVVSGTNGKPPAQVGTQEQPSGPQPPPFRFAVPDQPVSQIIPRSRVLNQLDQTQVHASAVPFGGSSGAISIPTRHTSFPYAGQLSPRSAVPQMGMRNFIPGPHPPNLPSPGVPRARNLPIQQNNFAQKTWPDIPLPPNQKFSNSHSIASSKPVYPADQIYDPFSPTSVAPPQQRGDTAK